MLAPLIALFFFCQSAASAGAENEIPRRAAELMAVHGVPGAAVFVVRDAKPVFEGAFGYSDLEKRARFDFEKTVFAAGSLSKIFTAAAILRLAELKKINLDYPVSRCLTSAAGPSALSKMPVFKGADLVTPLSLLTHSSGFANCSALYPPAGAAPSAAPRRAFEFIYKNAPRFDPKKTGRRFEYSNFNYALLGHLIEESENITFSEYMKNMVFIPLGMTRSSFSPDALPDASGGGYEIELAAGYGPGEGRPVESPLVEHNMPAASGLITCAADIEKFTLALLASLRTASSAGNGFAGIEPRKTASPAPAFLGAGPLSLMFTPRFAVNEKDAAPLDKFPPIDSMTAGFRHSIHRGLDIYWHTGSVRGFSCGLYLAPKISFACFIACNSSSPDFRIKMARFILDNL